MGLRHMVVTAFLTGCICLPLAAQQVDNVTFNNSDGMFSGTGLTSGSLSLNNSTLTQISGFTGALAGFDTTGTNLGMLNFTTGSLNPAGGSNAGTMVPLGNGVINQISTFATTGSSFTVVDSSGLTFTGTFASAFWQCELGLSCTKTGANSWKGTWQFTGNLTNVVLTVNGQQIAINGAVTIQATTLKGIAVSMAGGKITFTDSTGFTNFNLTVTPEPGTLALFGSGLIAMGALVKFSRPGRKDL